MLSKVKTCISTHTDSKKFLHLGTQWIIPNWISLWHTGTTHICRSAQGSGSPRTNSTSTTPNCCSSALLPNNRSAWTQEEEAERATFTSSPTSSTLCSMCSTRMFLVAVESVPAADVVHVFLSDFETSVSAVQELRRGRRRTCRVSRSSHVRNGWRARTRLKDRTISLSWRCTSCHLNAGGLLVYTSYEDSWSPHTPARSRQSAPTSTTLLLFLFLCFTTISLYYTLL